MSRYPHPEDAPLRLRLDLTGATYAVDPAKGREAVSDVDPNGAPRLRIMIPRGDGNTDIVWLEPSDSDKGGMHLAANDLGLKLHGGAA